MSSESLHVPIRIGAFIEHRHMAERINTALAPLYTFSYMITDVPELRTTLADIAKLEPSQRPVGWLVGGRHREEGVAELKGQAGVPVVVVPLGTLERVGVDNMSHYTNGLLDAVFRQPQSKK